MFELDFVLKFTLGIMHKVLKTYLTIILYVFYSTLGVYKVVIFAVFFHLSYGWECLEENRLWSQENEISSLSSDMC